MKVKKSRVNINVGLLILILSLTVAGTINQNQSFSPQYKLETPKSGDGEITIITPENKTYTGPDSGYYPATYGFENDEDGTVPVDWEIIQGSISLIHTYNQFNGHNKLLKIIDPYTSGSVSVNSEISSPATGTIEFWVYATGTWHIYTNVVVPGWMGAITVVTDYSSGEIRVDQTGDWEPVIYGFQFNTWNHLRFEFDCNSDNYSIILNGIQKADNINFHFPADKLNNITLGGNYYTAKDIYLDAFGYSWDPNYNVGDNLNEGLLLSYENTTNLDWKGYSLDGQANKTILGNTTIPMPADGVHAIQVFGNDSMGTIFESDVRYFTVNTVPPEITINSPTPSQVVGSTAPSYAISITGLYDSIWYSFDGGATNLTANSLTGTLNQAAWNVLSDGIITIDFYANNSAGMEGTAQVQVFKDSSEEPPNPPGIPGYNIIALIGVTLAVTLILAKRKLKK